MTPLRGQGRHQALRRAYGRRRRLVRRLRRHDQGPHRAERGREVDAVQRAHRIRPARRGLCAVRGRGTGRTQAARCRARGRCADVPEHAALRPDERSGERDGGSAGASRVGLRRRGAADSLRRSPTTATLPRRPRACCASSASTSGPTRRGGRPPAGIRRLLEIARALATGPQLLLLDEPAAGLNATETAELVQTLYRVRDARHHRPRRRARHGARHGGLRRDRRLDRGRKIAEGPPRMIQKDPAVIAAYLGEEVDDV